MRRACARRAPERTWWTSASTTAPRVSQVPLDRALEARMGEVRERARRSAPRGARAARSAAGEWYAASWKRSPST